MAYSESKIIPLLFFILHKPFVESHNMDNLERRRSAEELVPIPQFVYFCNNNLHGQEPGTQ